MTAPSPTGTRSASTPPLVPVIAVISVATGLTARTNGRLLWITQDGQKETWPAANTEAVAVGSVVGHEAAD